MGAEGRASWQPSGHQGRVWSLRGLRADRSGCMEWGGVQRGSLLVTEFGPFRYSGSSTLGAFEGH